ncbi:uncharacterized protein [Argopecten irradians]|uniref:uncharacterized protein n=1 Tax=Argopecten irradians TaxID=31199 RepID=UPI00371CE0EA
MQGLCVTISVLFFISTVSAGNYGHRRPHHGNIYGHNIIRTFPTHQQFPFRGQLRPQFVYNSHQSPYIGHQSHVFKTTIPYRGSGLVSTGLTSPFINAGLAGPTTSILQQPIQMIRPSHSAIYPSSPVVHNAVGGAPITPFTTIGTSRSIPLQTQGSFPIPIEGATVPFQSPGGIPVTPQGPVIQNANGPFPAIAPVSPIGIQTGSSIFQNNAIGGAGSQSVLGGIPATGNIQHAGFRDLGLNIPVSPNTGFDSVPLAYEQEQNGLQTGVPTLGSPFNADEKVGIPKFGGWASPGMNDVVIREDSALPVTIEHKSLAALLRKFHMK